MRRKKRERKETREGCVFNKKKAFFLFLPPPRGARGRGSAKVNEGTRWRKRSKEREDTERAQVMGGENKSRHGFRKKKNFFFCM